MVVFDLICNTNTNNQPIRETEMAMIENSTKMNSIAKSEL